MNITLRKILTWTVYPGVMAINLGLYYGMLAQGFNFAISSFVASIIGGLGLITILEIILPYRKEWAPNKDEIKTDLVFMMLIQVGLPKLLTILTAVYLISFTKSQGWQIDGYWPHHWPVWVQMLFMMFVADFLGTGYIVQLMSGFPCGVYMQCITPSRNYIGLMSAGFTPFVKPRAIMTH